MNLYRIYIPGVDAPLERMADEEQQAIDDALYSLGLRELPPGALITTEYREGDR